MAEFKFSCPQCGQKIRGDVNYAGLQINCPACQHPIVVPPPPSQPPIAPATRAAPVKSPKTFKPPPLKKILIAGVCAAALAAGIIASIHYGFWNSTRTIWSNWSALSGSKAQWNFAHGKITGRSTTGESMLASPEKYADVTFSATVQITNREASLAIRMQDRNNGYLVVFVSNGARMIRNNGYIALEKETSGNMTILATSRGYSSSLGQTARITVIAQGTLVEVRVNGKKLLQARDSTFTTGSIGIQVFGNPNFPGDATFSKVSFR
jgi:DNA-directed RNA polymerase subunit RPC12/RpoP